MKTRNMLWSQRTSFGKQTNHLIKDDESDECVQQICYGDCISNQQYKYILCLKVTIIVLSNNFLIATVAYNHII